MTRERDYWQWDPTGPMHPIFAHAETRRAYLVQKRGEGPLTPQEQQELVQGYPPYFYQGATFFGVPVRVSKSVNDGSIHHFLHNDPMQWETLSPPLSTKNWPQGPPGWVPLAPGVHYPIQKVEGDDLPEPWDVGFQRQLNGAGA